MLLLWMEHPSSGERIQCLLFASAQTTAATDNVGHPACASLGCRRTPTRPSATASKPHYRLQTFANILLNAHMFLSPQAHSYSPIDHIFQFHKALKRELKELETAAAGFQAAVDNQDVASIPLVGWQLGSVVGMVVGWLANVPFQFL